MKVLCSACRQPAAALPNPFYGKGLSVHEHLVFCRPCGSVGMVEKPSDGAPARCRAPRLTGFAALIAAIRSNRGGY